MLVEIFVALGAAALLLTLLVTLADVDNDTRIVFTLFSMVLWSVWAFNATSVRDVSNGEVVTAGYTSLLVIGFLFAILMAVSFLMQALDLYETEL